MGMNLTMIKAIQGHIDSSFDDDRWMLASGGSGVRLNFWFMGDDPDGPVVTCAVYPPNPDGRENAPAHSHSSDTIRIVVEGRFKVGTKWYEAGEMRIQEAGRIYGPEEVGPDGCKQIVIFEKRSSMFPNYVKDEDTRAHAAGKEAFNEMMAPFNQPRAARSAAMSR
jgi:hypothetical protein